MNFHLRPINRVPSVDNEEMSTNIKTKKNLGLNQIWTPLDQQNIIGLLQ
jgi:hypothetical protein